jgi:hypothetical protein
MSRSPDIDELQLDIEHLQNNVQLLKDTLENICNNHLDINLNDEIKKVHMRNVQQNIQKNIQQNADSDEYIGAIDQNDNNIDQNDNNIDQNEFLRIKIQENDKTVLLIIFILIFIIFYSLFLKINSKKMSIRLRNKFDQQQIDESTKHYYDKKNKQHAINMHAKDIYDNIFKDNWNLDIEWEITIYILLIIFGISIGFIFIPDIK